MLLISCRSRGCAPSVRLLSPPPGVRLSKGGHSAQATSKLGGFFGHTTVVAFHLPSSPDLDFYYFEHFLKL